MVLAGRKKLKLDVDFLADNFEAAGSTIFRSAFLSRLGISLHFIHHYTTLHYTTLHSILILIYRHIHHTAEEA